MKSRMLSATISPSSSLVDAVFNFESQSFGDFHNSFRDSLCAVTHDFGQCPGAGNAVGHMELGAHALGKGMAKVAAGVGETHAGEVGGQHHVLTGFFVGGFENRDGQPFDDQLDGFDIEQV